MDARILIVDDHQIMSDGLRLLLRGEADMEVVGNAFDTDAGWQAVVELAPDMVVMDLDVPPDGGAVLTARIRTSFPEIKIVVLTGHSEASHVEAALKAGADGYVMKASGSGDLLHALRTVLAGRNYLCPEASTAIVQELQRRSGSVPGPEPLLPGRKA